MKKRFLMSYPGPSWRIRGAQNFRSQTRATTNPRIALAEWLAFAELLAARGATLAPLPPPLREPAFTGLLYAANYGHLFAADGARPATFLLGRLSVAHRQEERTVVRGHVESLGLATKETESLWEGQAEICTLPGDRFILTFGVRSSPESVDEVSALLPSSAKTLVIKLREPFFHGDTCLNAVTVADGRTVLLAHEGALVDARLSDVEAFCAPDVEVLPVGEADALAYACNALSIGTDLLAAPGLSKELVAELEKRGVELYETPMNELFGKGGGGPRCLVNDLFDYEPPAAPFESWRAAAHASLAGYPETPPEG